MTANELEARWSELLERGDGQRVLIRGDEADVERLRGSLLQLSTAATATEAPVDARRCPLGEIDEVLDACLYRRVNCIALPFGYVRTGGPSLALLLSGAPRTSSHDADLLIDLA